MHDISTPAALAAYLRRTPTQAMREAIEQYEAGLLTIGELEMKLLFQVQRERDRSDTNTVSHPPDPS